MKFKIPALEPYQECFQEYQYVLLWLCDQTVAGVSFFGEHTYKLAKINTKKIPKNQQIKIGQPYWGFFMPLPRCIIVPKIKRLDAWEYTQILVNGRTNGRTNEQTDFGRRTLHDGNSPPGTLCPGGVKMCNKKLRRTL